MIAMACLMALPTTQQLQKNKAARQYGQCRKHVNNDLNLRQCFSAEYPVFAHELSAYHMCFLRF